MPSPLPLLIAVLALAASPVLAQEATLDAEASAPVAKPPEVRRSELKPSEKKALAAAATTSLTKKTGTKATPPTPKPSPKPTPSAKTKAGRKVPFVARDSETDAEPEERPLGFWERLFGRRRPPEATPAPSTPVATPTPKPIARTKKPKSSSSTTKPKTAAKPAEKKPTTSPEPAARVDSTGGEETSLEKPAAKAPVIAAAPKATPAAKPAPANKPRPESKGSVTVTPAATPARRPPVAPASDADAEAQEKYRYEVAKSKALEDAEVQKLKEKADGAVSDDEARKAQRAYNKALFNKMRTIDSSIKDRADRIEAAIFKRLETAE